MIILSASGINSATHCVGMAAAKSFGARANSGSDFRQKLKDNGHLFFTPFNKFSASAAVGTSCHKGAEFELKEKLSGLKPSLSAANDAAISELRSQDLEFDDETRTMNDAEKKTLKMLSIFDKNVLEKIDPKTVENRLSIEINEFVITGQTDVVEMDDSIVDHKFGKSKASGYLVQMGINSILVGGNSGSIKISTVDPKSFDDKIYDFEKKQAEILAQKMLKRIIPQIRDYMKTGDPMSFDFNPGNNLCSERFCPAYGREFCAFTFNKGK